MVDPMDNLNDGDELELPAAMRAQLRDEFGSPSGRPSAAEWARVDAVIQHEAASHFSKTPDKPVLWRIGRIAAALATAAMVGIVVWINSSTDRRADESPRMTSSETPARPPHPGDINRDGRLDILDAYLLQRRIETAAKIEAQWDLTRDGQVDQRDVQAIAAQSVKLAGGPRL